MRKQYKITMTLLSEAIFGSGFSIPGGADISNYADEKGYPYFKGTSLKGILRENAVNYAAWAELPEKNILSVFGTEGRGEFDEARRLYVSELRLKNPPEVPADCYIDRSFTKIENGLAAEGSLRTAECVRRGLVFEGSVSCAAQDSDLILAAVKCVRWVGTLRNRGFGAVKLCAEEQKSAVSAVQCEAAGCIKYTLHTETPLQITDQASSTGIYYRGRSYIPGSAVRGMVISRIKEDNPQWFKANKTALLSDGVRFLNALPVCGAGTPVPAIRGIYSDKQGTAFENICVRGELTPGLKRTNSGGYNAFRGDTIVRWKPKTVSAGRINTGAQDDAKKMFTTEQLAAGQDFEGYILLDDPALADVVARAFAGEIRMGTDRYEGYGKCSAHGVAPAGGTAAAEEYGYAADGKPGQTLYLLLMAPTTMLNEAGSPCGLNTEALASLLGVENVSIAQCSTGLEDHTAYNRTWGCREPRTSMYAAGSVFKLCCNRAPEAARLAQIQSRGIGIRRAEGYGQVLFIRNELFEGLNKVEPVPAASGTEKTGSFRRNRYAWLMEYAQKVNACGISNARLGLLQSLCQKAILRNGDTGELDNYLSATQNERDAATKHDYSRIKKLIEEVLAADLPELGVSGKKAKLELLCELFDHSRKIQKEAGK